jgi:hypothetical protein
MRCLLLFLGSFKLVVGSCDDADEVLVRLISSVAFGLASRRRRTQAMRISVGEITLPAEYGKKKKLDVFSTREENNDFIPCR